MASPVASKGVATASPATGTIRATSAVALNGSATAPQPAKDVQISNRASTRIGCLRSCRDRTRHTLRTRSRGFQCHVAANCAAGASYRQGNLWLAPLSPVMVQAILAGVRIRRSYPSRQTCRGLRDAESRANPHPRRYRRKPGQAVVLRHQEQMPSEYRRARRLRGTSSVDGARCALSKIAPRQTAIRISIVEAHPALAVTCHTPLRDEDLGPAIPVAKVIGAVAGTLAENPLRVALIDFPLLVTDAGRSIADDVRARA